MNMSKAHLTYLLKTMTMLCLVLYLCDKIVYYGLLELSKHQYSGRLVGKLNQYLRVKDQKRVLVFGSSRASYNVDPAVIDTNSFNAGAEKRDLAYSTTLIKMTGSSKQLLLLQIDPALVYDSTYLGKDIEALAWKYHQDDLVKSETDRLGLLNSFQHFFWCLGFNNTVLSLLINSMREESVSSGYRGYDPLDVSPEQREIFLYMLKTQAAPPCKDHLIINPLIERYLRELAQFADQNHKELVFFSSPEYADSCKNDNGAFARLSAQLGIEYLDFSDTFKNQNSIHYWKDRIHLSREGSQLFSRTLAKSLAPKLKKLTN